MGADAPKFADSLLNTPLWGNSHVRTVDRKQSIAENTKAILATLALLIGGAIYVLWRGKSLLMFTWFDALGMGRFVEALREYAGPYSQVFPHWVYFSLPQALWLFGGIVFFHCIWRNGAFLNKLLWITVFAVTAFGFELGQYLHLVPGYFDLSDMLLLIVAFLAAGMLVRFGDL